LQDLLSYGFSETPTKAKSKENTEEKNMMKKEARINNPMRKKQLQLNLSIHWA